ncbi:MAG: nitrogen fixation protein NifX [Rhodospirillales bacterium]|nr:MAG: nitrogen fixation protein NifX [Rhodospirillales bacterium]
MKIAFATQDLKTMDAHFAGARNLAIYDIGPDGYRFLEAIRFDVASNEDGLHAEAHEDRLTPRVDALDGCALLFVLAIGGPAAARVVNRKIHPVKLPRPEPIAQILDRVQAMINGTPPPWLRKALGSGHTTNLAFLEGEAAE